MIDLNQARYAINRLYNMAVMMLGRGRSTTPVDDSGVFRKLQAQLGFNQIKDNFPYVQHYGFASNPPVGTDCIAGFIAGDRSNGCIVATNNQTYAIKNLGDGTVALYDMFGNTVILNNLGITLTDLTGNVMSMLASGVKITSPAAFEVDAPNVRLHATATFKWDCGGNGPSYTPTVRTDYVIGSTGTSENLNPPEIP